MQKKTYQRPSMEKLGSFEAITKSLNAGSSLDGNFNGIVEPNILS